MIEQPTPPEPDALDPRLLKQRRTARNRRFGALAVAAVIIAVAVVAVITLQDGNDGGGPADTTSPSAFVPVNVVSHSYLDIATGERTPVEANLTGANLPEVSPNGESVVYFTFDDGIYISALDGSGEVPISPDGLDGYAATWIDDETILFQGRSTGAGENELGDLYAADVSTGEATMVTDLPDVKHGAWFIVSDVSPDGTTVLFHLPRKGKNAGYDLWTAPIAGGEAALLRKDAGFAQYGPDGSVVFLDRPVSFEGDAIWIMDGDGRHARLLVEGGRYTTWPRFSPDGTTVSYANDEMLEIVDVASGEVTTLDASTHEADPAWYDDDTLIVD
jgi:Tol biopolymer transport system component